MSGAPMVTHADRSPSRHAAIVALAVVVFVVSLPLRRIVAQGTSAGTDLLYGTSQNNFYIIDPSTHVTTLTGTYCPSSGASFYLISGAAPDGTLSGFAAPQDCEDPTVPLWWSRLDPDTGVITHISPVPTTVAGFPFAPVFLGSFGAPGTPVGYRFQGTGQGTQSLLGSLDLYAVDYLSPYQEHLLYTNVGASRFNYGLGAAVLPDASQAFFVTTDAVYALTPLSWASNTPFVQAGFLSVYRLSRNAKVANVDSSGNTFYIADGGTVFAFQPGSPFGQFGQITNSFLARPLTQIVSLTMRRSPWGGVRLEPDHGLSTTRDGGSATFTAVLTAQPTANVTVNFSSTNLNEGSVSPSAATFTTANWNVPQTISVIGADDGGSSAVGYAITSTTASGDPNYIGRNVVQVGVTNGGGGALPPTPSGPTITAIPNQTIPMSGSTTVSYAISGSIIPSALTVTVTSSDTTLVPASALQNSCAASGACTLTITGADGRSGTATITIAVSDGRHVANTSFALFVGVGADAPVPSSLIATPSGSGAVLTWLAPPGSPPTRYVISGGITPGGHALAAIVTPDASTFYVFPFLGAGTYDFRVQALSEIGNGLGTVSADAAVTIGGGGPGFVTGTQALVGGQTVTLTWSAPSSGPVSSYWVEGGSGLGARDLFIAMAGTTTFTKTLDAGTYYFRVRAVSGAAIGPPSNEVAVVVQPAACSEGPGTPTLLPVTTIGGQVTFSWVNGIGGAADHYGLQLSNGTALSVAGSGTSVVWPQASGSFTASVAAGNTCGNSGPSTSLAFTIQP
jgi:hypothetical protein